MLGLALPGNVAGADQLGQFLLGSALFITLVAVNILKPRFGFKLISTFYVVGLIGVALAIITVLSAGRGGVENYINGLNIPNTTYVSLANSYTGPSFDLGATLLMLPYFALFTYPWFNAAPSVGSELKGKASAWNVPISLLAAFLVVTIPYAIMYYVGGFAFTTAALSNPTLVNNFAFNFFTLAMGLSPNLLQSFIIGLAWIVLTLAILAFGIITISRYMLAQSFDRFLPSKLAYVSSRYGSPVVAHLLDMVVTVALIGLAAFLYGPLSSLYGAVMASMIYFAFVGVAAVIRGVRKEKGQAMLILVVAGLLQTLVFIYLTYEFLAYPSIWGGNALAYGYIASTFILGALIYAYRKTTSSKQGFSIELAFKEIPPE
jgi:amino acid transporter